MHAPRSVALSLLIAVLMLPATASTSAPSFAHEHPDVPDAPATSGTEQLACVEEADLLTGSTTSLVVGDLTYILQPEAVLDGPDVEEVSVDSSGALVSTIKPGTTTLIEGQLGGNRTGRFFITVSELGIDGILTPDGEDVVDVAGSGGLDRDGLVCGLAELVPVELVSATEASDVSALATSDVKVLIGVDSEMYTAFSPSASTVATNVFNRARNSFSSNFGQSVSSYLVLTSTSGSADTLTGMHGSSAGEWLFNWGTYANGRSDRLSFHMASLQSHSPEPTSGQDGRSYTAGRYNVIWNQFGGGNTALSSNWYQHVGVLLAHEMGHNFEATDRYPDEYYVFATTCFGGVYQPSLTHLCVGYSSNCQGTTLPLFDSAGRPFCVGNSPPVVAETHKYVMDGDGYHNPGFDVYWESTFSTASRSEVNACLPNWHSISRTVTNVGC